MENQKKSQFKDMFLQYWQQVKNVLNKCPELVHFNNQCM